ncbi:hypothetical protein [Nonomuraea basaltis]|uniref:hypothetical protein n=1 Tax=Nonomuraea basaltis TaxID=2495887 RepID=UPI00110C54C6|nr:hypothetical protein [Nonomuraea basaltis]TMR96748.1 hypothetical protein EJK15_21460 [Nonomuraea basaltis]
MIKKLHQMGLRSSHMYTAGALSIAVSFGTWFLSRNVERAGLDRADRWGIFIGEWAPTCFALGVALRMEETHREIGEPEMGVYDEAERARARTPAGI